MGSPEDEALSDLEDDAAPIVLPVSGAPAGSNADSLKSLVAELESERQARKAAESAKADFLVRLKTFSRQRDEALKQKEEAQHQKEELLRKLNEALQMRDDAIKHRDDIAHQRDEAIKMKDEFSRLRDEATKARETTRSEIEAAARLLVAGAERITSRASAIHGFPGNLPRSTSHTGVAAIAYGFTKRAEDVVDELVRQHDLAVKSRSQIHEQMEQRNYQIAIEVSELEASIQMLKDELSQKSLEMEKLQKLLSEKDERVSEIEQGMSNKLTQTHRETESLKKEVEEAKHKIHRMKGLMLELSHLIFKANETLLTIADSFSFSQMDKAKKTPSSGMDKDPEEGLLSCISRFKELVDLCLKLGSTWKEHRELGKKELDDLHATITRLEAEKNEITNFLRSALSNKEKASSNGGNDNASIGAGMDKNRLPHGDSSDYLKSGEVVSMAFALENEIKSLREDIFELQQLLATARGELQGLRVTTEHQAEALSVKSAQVQDLEENLLLHKEKIENLNFDLAAARQESMHWKEAATKEAEAGGALLEEIERCQEESVDLCIHQREYIGRERGIIFSMILDPDNRDCQTRLFWNASQQSSTLREQIKQLRLSLEESNGKLRSKEEMTMAAITAQNAAERSLRIADGRAVELRERLEELTRQFDALEGQGNSGLSMGLFDMCWPYQWLRGRPLFVPRSGPTQPEAEMEELLEPLV